MLSIVNLLKKNTTSIAFNKEGETIRVHKRDIPLSKEWYNSVYVFTKNSIRFLPAVHYNLFKSLKSYFNMTNLNLEVNIRSRKYKKLKRSYGNKVWISTPEIKHLNEKITITVYVYNKLYSIYKKKLNLLEFTWGQNIIQRHNVTSNLTTINLKRKTDNNILVLEKKTISLRHKYPTYLGINKARYNKTFYVKMIKWLKLDKYINIKQYKLDIIELINKDNKVELLKGLLLLNIERYNYLINQFKKELIYLKLKQKMLFNEFKFTELYLTPLINFLQTIYKKRVELNIVIIKNHYLSSSILSQIIVAKVISEKYRGKSWAPLGNSIVGTNIPNLSSKKIERVAKKWIGMQNVILDTIRVKKKQDNLDKFLLTNNKNSNNWSSKNIDKLVLKNLENKSIAGIFLNLSGRLTKRYKAQRAISNLKYRGTLKNVYSAHKGFSSALSRGYNNINVEKTVIHSKVRIGAFGLTGWVASY